MEELSITYQPHAPHSLYAPCVQHIGQRDGELEMMADVQPSAMTFRELIRAIVQLIKEYVKGRKHDR